MATPRFNAILATRSYSHLRAVFDEYKKISSKTMEQAISSEMSGDLERGYLAIGNACIYYYCRNLFAASYKYMYVCCACDVCRITGGVIGLRLVNPLGPIADVFVSVTP